MDRVWTVAKLTIAESLRMKIAVFFIVLLGVLVIGLPFASTGDNSVSGAVQSFLSYSITTVSFLLSCLSIFMAKSLSDDLREKQIQMLMTKPLARWQYVLGKWFGIVLLNLLLLAVAGALIYAMTMYLAGRRRGLVLLDGLSVALACTLMLLVMNRLLEWRSSGRKWLGLGFLAIVSLGLAALMVAGVVVYGEEGWTRLIIYGAIVAAPAGACVFGVIRMLARWPSGTGRWAGILLPSLIVPVALGGWLYGLYDHQASIRPRDAFDEERLESEILQARHATKFILPVDEFKARANQTFEQYLKEGRYANRPDINEEKEKAELAEEIEKRWRSVLPGETRVFQFQDVRVDRSEGNTVQIRYQMRVYGYPPDEILRHQWIVGDRTKDTSLYVVPRRDVVDRRHTLSVPADAVAPDKTLTAVFANIDPYSESGRSEYPSVAIFEGPDAVEAMFAVGPFGSNLVRALSLVMFRLAFLAALAVAATTVFSFPVAAFASLVLYGVAATQGFLSEALMWFPEGGAGKLFQFVMQNLLRALYVVLPSFDQYDALATLIDGRVVTLKWVLLGIGKLLLIHTGALLLIAWLMFQRREVSEVSV